ncbi:MAG: alpha/beta hydrolase [Actinobacteria bacterium]|nr:alpha/beta hydrolase [Actinomycetota bacterium]
MRTTNGVVEIEYETVGDNSDPALLLVCGLSSQLIAYRRDFCQLLADAGFYVVRYDNRDVGLSSKTAAKPPSLVATRDALNKGLDSPASYGLSDMALDGMAVLDALGIVRSHIWGMSMGGMIVQTMAINHWDRVLSITSVMSTTGASDVGRATPEASAALMAVPPLEREAHIAADLAARHTYASADIDWDEMASYAGAQYDRMFHPVGAVHQLAAVIADGDRTDRLKSVDVPCTVLHGGIDTLIDVSGGHATAEAIDGAKLVVYDTMGHDLPATLWPSYVDEMVELADRAS